MTDITNLILLAVFMQNCTRFTHFLHTFLLLIGQSGHILFSSCPVLQFKFNAVNSGVLLIWALAWYHTKDVQTNALWLTLHTYH